MHVRERQARHSVCERVCVKSVCHVGIVALHTVHSVKHATNQEGVSIVTTTKTCAKTAYWLKVSRMEVSEQDYFLVEALCVHCRVE